MRKRSEARVAADRDFSYLQEDIALYKKLMADKSVSLNEEARLKEKKENEQRAEARKKERQARHEAEDKVYEITLKQADLPGLPPPAARTNDLAKSQTTAEATKTGDDQEDPEDRQLRLIGLRGEHGAQYRTGLKRAAGDSRLGG